MKNLAKMVKEEQTVVNLKPSDMFLKDFSDFGLKFLTESGREPSKSINPSSFYKCIRAMWYKLHGFEQGRKENFRGQVRLLHGTYVHTMVQDVLMSNMHNNGITLLAPENLSVYYKDGIEFTREHDASEIELKFRDRRFTSEFPVSAMVDGAFEYQNLRYIFEFKTINTKDFEYLYEPLKEHVIQGALYSLCLEIPRVMFMYFDKDKDIFKVFIVQYTDTQKQWTKDRLVAVDTACASEELPDKEEGDNCKYCPYVKLCKSDIGTK